VVAKPNKEDFQRKNACFTCGQTGHYARQCPKNGKTQANPKPQVNYVGQFPNRNYIQGQVHHISAEEASEVSDVVIGMFPVNDIPATILFDSGASHSFISRSFVAQHRLSYTLLDKVMVVQSPGSRLRTNIVCRGLEISINRVIFLASLVSIESPTLDIILGMDWLSRHQVCINCATREVTLINPSVQSARFFAGRAMQKKGMVYATIATDMNLVPVVYEFPDVFPDELPGMPPNRELEFSIELVPGTAPIYKKYY
jgi:hypothetical protein